jgi:uncharacterized protein (TIGR00369 family)
MNIDLMNGLDVLGKIIKGEIPRPTMAETIPMNLVKAEKGFAEFQGKAGKAHLNPMGTVHGGFAATLLDSATGCAVHSMLGPGEHYGTVDLNVKMLKPVPVGVALKARAKIIHCSRRLGVSEGSLKDDAGTVYAHATATCMIYRMNIDKHTNSVETSE